MRFRNTAGIGIKPVSREGTERLVLNFTLATNNEAHIWRIQAN
jgi:isocitrate dehydrogenase